MQSDVDGNIIVDQEEDGQDSLFGSPPSSPIRGRSPSPALALPSASNSTQNVGTIALPGSHHYSELPVTPLALSLSNALNQLPHRPPALSTDGIISTPATSSSSPTWSRASSTAPASRPNKRSHNKKSKESTPRPPPPEIPLPDPSVPVPANFLRNQSALLGTAGLVGGVKPANLCHTRGANAFNPIVIEDEHENEPALSTNHSFKTDITPAPMITSTFRRPYCSPVNPNRLPTPTSQDVVAMLIGQKDIFPVLENLLRLISSGSAFHPTTTTPPFRTAFQTTTATTSTSSPTLSGPPLKKRKLTSVPAGAADWDVPYPFPPGQGPESYRTNWERERGKQLISQLVTLIKNAAQKASMRLYVENEKAKRWVEMQGFSNHPMRGTESPVPSQEPKIYGHYRPSAMYGQGQGETVATPAQTPAVLSDTSNNVRPPLHSPYPQPSTGSSSVSDSQPQTPFDQLISSLLAATPEQTFAACQASAAPTLYNMPADPTDDSATPGSSNGLDTGMFDNWMDILQTFSTPSGGFPPPQYNWGLPPQPSATIPDNEDFSLFNFEGTSTDFSDMFTVSNAATPSVVASNNADSEHGPVTQMEPPTDFSIDPSLLAISVPQAPLHSPSTDNPPSLAPSPMPSMSSYSEDPATPSSATWDLSTPDIFTGLSGDPTSTERFITANGEYRSGGLAGQGMLGRALWNNFMQTYDYDFGQGGPADEDINMDVDTLFSGQRKEDGAKRADKGKGRDMGESVLRAPPLLLPTPVQPSQFQTSGFIPPLPSNQFSIGTSTVQTVVDKPPPSKAQILKRAAERKKQLQDEINQTKIHVWETMIEHGILLHMNKLCGSTT